MKRKFYRSCVAVLLSMVMIFGGVHIGTGAIPPDLLIRVLSDFYISTPNNTYIAKGATFQIIGVVDPPIDGLPIYYRGDARQYLNIE